MKSLITGLIWLYQGTLSPVLRSLFGKGCRFQPTCSEYAKDSIQRHGALKGGLLALRRISRCHPLSRVNLFQNEYF